MPPTSTFSRVKRNKVAVFVILITFTLSYVVYQYYHGFSKSPITMTHKTTDTATDAAKKERAGALRFKPITVIKSTHQPLTRKAKSFLCFNLPGRIGNKMMAYASMFGVAKSKGMAPSYFDDSGVFSKIFKQITATVDITRCAGYFPVYNKLDCGFDKADVAFSSTQNTSFHGYFQSWMFFKDSKSDIRREFSFMDWATKSAEESIRKSVKNLNNTSNLTYVTIHVRRSDILENKVTHDFGYLSPGPKYYDKATKWFRDRYQNVVFVVCSDRITWAKNNLNNSHSDLVFIEGASAEVDLVILSLGNHTIMSVGTYGWWGAFLAGGQTIAYKTPAREGSKLRAQFSNDLTDFFMPEWILMDDN